MRAVRTYPSPPLNRALSVVIRHEQSVILSEWEAVASPRRATLREDISHLLDELADGKSPHALAGSGETLNETLDGVAALRKVTVRHLGTPDAATAEEVHAFFDRAMRDAAAAQLRADTELRDRILGILSHDLRNPLGAISVGIQLILADESLKPMARRAGERVASSSARMIRMIRDLLDLTRSTRAAGLPLARTETDAVAVANDVVEELKTAHPAIAIDVRVDAPSILGEWDRDRLAQVLSNLLGNALDHGVQNAPITLDMRARDAALDISVSNQGPAIPADVQESIFDPFHRGQPKRAGAHGLGLGLYIVRQIAHAHGGEVSLAKSDGTTTTFTVRLPRREP